MEDLTAAVIAIENELGTDPAGSLGDVKTFLQLQHQSDGTHKSTHGPHAYIDEVNYANFSSAVIAAANKTLVVARSINLDADTVIGATVSLMPLNPGVINANGFTLTINAPVVGNPMHPWLSGFAAGDVIFNYNKINILHGPEFFVRHGQECGGAINEMLQAAYLPASGSTPDYDINGRASIKVALPTGIFLTNETIIIPPMIELVGSSRMSTMIAANNVSADPVIEFSNSTSQLESLLQSLTISGNDKGVVGILFSDGIQSQHNFITINNVYVTRCTTSIDGTAGSGKYIIYTKIKNSRFDNASLRHILLNHGVNYMEIKGNNFFGALPYDIEFASTFAGDYVLIEGNSFDDDTTIAKIIVQTVSGNGSLSAIIRHNRIETSSNGIGISIASAYAIAHIVDNSILSCLTPISISGKYCIVDKNNFQGAQPNSTHAIIINSGAQYNTIKNTNSYGEPNSNYPIRITNNGSFTKIEPTYMGNAYTGGGTHEKGDIYHPANTRSKIPTVFCTTSGTIDTFSTTGSINYGSATLTVVSASGITRGCYLTIAGVTGVKKVLYLTGTTLTLDSNADATVSGAAIANSAPVFTENIGIYTTPSLLWASDYGLLQIGSEGALVAYKAANGGQLWHAKNAYYDGVWKYKNAGSASLIEQTSSGQHIFKVAGSGSADANITWSTALQLDSDGDIKMPTLLTYANNAAAVAGGLVVGQLYRTNSDPDSVCVVH